MKNISRRDFIKTAVIGGATISLGSAILHKPMDAAASGKYDIGQCKKLKITCVSEVGWWSNDILLRQIMASPGKMNANQWAVPWDVHNAAGSCSLVEVELLDGTKHKFLIDTGWNKEYMDEAFKREGVDKMLKNHEIEFLLISHEHLDHYWALETTLKYDPGIKIIIPETFYPEGMSYLKGADFPEANTSNKIPHKGELVKTQTGKVAQLYPGVAVTNFDLPIIVRVRGEESLYFNVKDKGMVCVTGCCHQNVLNLSDYAVNNLVGGDNLYGLYGGLHIAPFGLNDAGKNIVRGMAKYNYKKIASNHCTGVAAVKMMIDLGYPVVKGTGRFGSMSDLYIGNGDSVEFG
jgi:7,8-dihydropterin-6-yl-methyl-4-(beta-D-ribofuranosyl)aminobenzene 5'-phosphate synthase